MLLNGTKLGYSASGTSPITYTDLTGLKDVPDLGNEKEKVDNTGIADTNKQYEYGIGDYGELEYKFKYVNTGVNSPYRVMREYATNNTEIYFQEELPDRTKFAFSGYVSVKIAGGAVNGVGEWILKIAPSSDITVTDPT